MSETPDPIHVAALEVVTSVSEQNLRHGATYKVGIPRAKLLALQHLLEEEYPGAIEHIYKAEKEEA